MPATMAFVSTKGGVGKSSLALLTGTYSARCGSRTLIADLHAAQRTCKDWGARRNARSASVVIDVGLFKSPAVALEQRDYYDLIIFDAGGSGANSDKARTQAATLSDLIIIPITGSRLDLQGSMRFAQELIFEGVEKGRIIFVVYGHASFSEAEEARAIVCDTGFNCACTSIPWLAGYSGALNKGLSLIETTHPALNDRASRLGREIIKTLPSQLKLV
jgi:chromosome partitioning protein